MFILKWRSNQVLTWVWIVEYFVFQEKVSISVGSSLHANANQVQITNFKPLRSVILVIVEAKIVFLDFLEFKALRAPKSYIAFHIYLRAICGRKERKIDFSTSAAKIQILLGFSCYLLLIIFYILEESMSQ